MNIKYIPKNEIEQCAQSEHSKYCARYGTGLPIKAEHYLETQYDITIMPLPSLRLHGLRCGFSWSGDTVYVDEAEYCESNDKYYPGLRFSFAHEIGHMNLHRNILPSSPPQSYEELGDKFEAKEHDRLETQANMFAAHFVMPTHLVNGILATKIMDNIDILTEHDITLEGLANFLSQHLASEFGVSVEAMGNRLKKLDYSVFTDNERSNILISKCDRERIRSLSRYSREKSAVDNLEVNPEQIGDWI